MRDVAARLSTVLGLELPPVALRFVPTPPPDAAAAPPDLPSACSMWRAAERSTFYAPAESHHGCAVGTMVMGFPIEAVGEALSGVVTAMVECGYLSAEEAEAIPTMPAGHAGIVYGPLADASEGPDLALLWVDAKQAMLLNEAVGTAAWNEERAMTLSGRPGCAVLPRSLRDHGPAVSTGCIGMRTFTGAPDHLMPVAVPGAVLPSLVDDLERLGRSNETMLGLYTAMLDQASAPAEPAQA